MAEEGDFLYLLSVRGWIVVGIIGLGVFVLGIYQPALRWIPYWGLVEILLAIAGGGLAVLGFSYAADRRAEQKLRPAAKASAAPLKGRAREVSIAPSFEVYDPRSLAEPTVRPELAPADNEPTDD